jgi:hypothetical protein
MKRNWIGNSSMNLLVDYYPEVQFRPYGATCTLENTVPWLKQLDLGYLCMYAKGHSGYTTWSSSLHTAHRMLGQDMVRLFREATRAAGCKLVLYYSGLLDGVAGVRHPDWRMLDLDGTPKNPFAKHKMDFFLSWAICPLSPYWDEVVKVHLDELMAYEPDGFWVDGDWPGPCYCPRCQARFRAESGWTGPWSEMVKRPDFNAAYLPFWKRLEHEWRTTFSAYVKEKNPNCLYSAGNVSARREFAAPFDWRSGDFFSPGFFNLQEIAHMMRWYGTLDVPYDAYVCDTNYTHARPGETSRSKPLDRMLQEVSTVAANGGAVGYWTYPSGAGALTPSRMRKAARVREFLREREAVFLDTRTLGWTGIVASDPAMPRPGCEAVRGASKALSALHRSPDIMDEAALEGELRYDLLVLPEQGVVSDGTVKRLAAFVKAGGKLLTSGASIRSAALRDLLGIRSVREGELAEGHVLVPGCDEPTGIDAPWDRIEPGVAGELDPLYRSWDAFNPECRGLHRSWPMHGQMDEVQPEPAGWPAATLRRLGKGLAVHIGTGIFTRYCEVGDPQIRHWLARILAVLQPEPLFTTDAPSWVDVSLRRKGEAVIVHFVSQNPGRDVARFGSNDYWADELPETGPYACRLRLARKPDKVTLAPGGSDLPFEWAEGVLRFECPRFRVHVGIGIQCAGHA